MNKYEPEYEHIAIDSLIPHPENPRQGDVQAIAESIRANGFYGAVIAQRTTGYIIAGNHRWRAAQEVGMTEIPVMWADVDDEQALRILLADNRTSDKATYDQEALLDLLGNLEDFTGTGYTADDANQLQALIESLPPPEEPPRPSADTALATEASGRTPPLGLKEVRLVFNESQHERFVTLVQQAHDKFGTTNTSQAVLEAMRSVDPSGT